MAGPSSSPSSPSAPTRPAATSAPDPSRGAAMPPDVKALQHGRLRVALGTVFLTLAFLLALVATGASRFLVEALDELLGHPARWVLLLAYALALGGLYKALKIPSSYLYEVHLERRYGHGAPSAAHWLRHGLREAAGTGLFVAPFLLVLDQTIVGLGRDWWMAGWIVLFLISLLLSRKAPVFLVPFVTPYDKISDPDLAGRIQEQCRKAGIRFAGLYEFEPTRRTRKIRISFTGFGRTKRVVLVRGLREAFPPEEIEAGFATEAAHYRLHHFGKGLALSAVTSIAGAWAIARAHGALLPRMGFTDYTDLAAFPLLAFELLVFTLVTFPFLASISRRFEYAADRYAVSRLTTPSRLAAYLLRLARLTLADLEPNPWIEFLLYPYPALARRLEAIREPRGPRAGLH